MLKFTLTVAVFFPFTGAFFTVSQVAQGRPSNKPTVKFKSQRWWSTCGFGGCVCVGGGTVTAR